MDAGDYNMWYLPWLTTGRWIYVRISYKLSGTQPWNSLRNPSWHSLDCPCNQHKNSGRSNFWQNQIPQSCSHGVWLEHLSIVKNGLGTWNEDDSLFISPIVIYGAEETASRFVFDAMVALRWNVKQWQSRVCLVKPVSNCFPNWQDIIAACIVGTFLKLKFNSQHKK